MPQIEQRWLFGPHRSAADSGADSADRCTSIWDGRSGWFTVCGLNAMVVAVSSVLLVSMLLSFYLLHRRTRYAAGQDEDDDGDGGGGGGMYIYIYQGFCNSFQLIGRGTGKKSESISSTSFDINYALVAEAKA